MSDSPVDRDLEVVGSRLKWSAHEYSASVAEKYGAFSKEAFWGAYHYQAAVGLYHSNVAERGGDVLEIGCGPGWLSLLMNRLCPGPHYHLLDQSQEMLAVANANVGAGGEGRFSFHRGDAMQLPFPDGSFDLVVSQFMLRHLDRPVAALREAYRVLRPGGLVYFTDVLADMSAQVKEELIANAPGPNGPTFIKAALDSALPRATHEGFLEEAGIPAWELRTGPLGGFPYPSRTVLDWIKKGFPLRQLQADSLRRPWTVAISPYWAHIYLTRPENEPRSGGA